MPELTSPTMPAATSQPLRDEWIGEIDRLFTAIERWAATWGWATFHDQKSIREANLGTYSAPVLLIHAPQGRVLFSPFASEVFAADGVIDLIRYPSFDAEMHLVRTGGDWHLEPLGGNESSVPWTEGAFAEAIRRLLVPGVMAPRSTDRTAWRCRARVPRHRRGDDRVAPPVGRRPVRADRTRAGKEVFNRAADNLDATYLIRLFAEFETGFAQGMATSAQQSPPIPERWNCSRLLCPASKSRPTGTWRLTMCESTATFSFTRWMTL